LRASRIFIATTNNVVAHFHEWMTGAGVLYLKNKAPQISTAFTTHATVLGRSIAGNGLLFTKILSNIKQIVLHMILI